MNRIVEQNIGLRPHLSQNDGFTVGMLVAFQMFAGRMSQPMLRLVLV